MSKENFSRKQLQEGLNAVFFVSHWSDWRSVYGDTVVHEPRYASPPMETDWGAQFVGTLLIMAPIAAFGFWLLSL